MTSATMKLRMLMGLEGDHQVTQGLRRVEGATRGASDTAGRMGANANAAGAGLGRMRASADGATSSMNTLKRAAAPLLGLLTSLASIRTFKSMIDEADQFERNMLRTQAVVRATGQAAGFTAEQLRRQAQDLARATLQSVEGVEQAQQILLTFRSVSGETFTRATELAADLATVTGTGLTGAMTQLGKALEDPVQGINALRRSGVSFSEEQRTMIESLVESNRLMEAQALVLDELARQYGGVAQAEAQGYAGAVDSMGQAWQELKIAIADAGDFLERGAQWIERVTEHMQEFTAVLASGQIDYYLQAIRHQFGMLWQDAQQALHWITELMDESAQYWGVTGESAVDFIIAAFKNFGPNVRAFIQIAATEIAALVDRAIVYGKAIGRALDPRNWFADGPSISEYVAQENARINQIRMEMYDQILAERDATIAGTGEIIKAGAQKRREWEQQQAIFDAYTATVVSGTQAQAAATRDLAAESAEAQRRLSELAARFRVLRRELDPASSATEDLVEKTELLIAAWEAGLIKAERFDDLLERLYDDTAAVAEVTKAAAEQANPFMVAWESAIERIDGLFVDLWESGLRGFRSFAEALKNTFNRLLAEMAHAALTRPIVVGLGGVMAPGSAGAAGGAGGGLGGGMNLGGLLNPGALSGLQSTLGHGLANMGFANAGTWLGSLSDGLFGGLTAGIGGALITGLSTGNWVQAGFGGVGAGIGMAFGGPIGAIIGGTLGNLVGGLFGGKPSNRSAWGAIDLDTNEMSRLGNMTGKKQASQQTMDARTAILEMVGQISNGIRTLGGQIEGELVLDVGERDGIQVNIGNGMQRLGSDIEAALTEISNLLIRKADWSGLLNNATFGLLNEQAQAAIRAQVQGGMGLQEIEGLATYFAQLEGVMGQISEQIKLSEMSDYERQIYRINQQFDALAAQLRAMGVDLEKYTDLEKARAIALREVEASLSGHAARVLRDILSGPLGNASPEQIYFSRLSAFEQARLSGNEAALPELGRALLEASRDYYASGAGYQQDFAEVTKVLGEIAGIEGSPTLAAAERQIALLEDIRNVLVGGASLPSFAVGSAFVPRDMRANIHQGEMILDRQFADGLRRYGIPVNNGESKELIAEVRNLRAELAEIKGHAAAQVRTTAEGFRKSLAIGERQAEASGVLAGRARLEASA